MAHHRHACPLSLLDGRKRSLPRARHPGSSFLSRHCVSHPAEPARHCNSAAVARWLLPGGPDHSWRMPGVVDRSGYQALEQMAVDDRSTILTAFNDNAEISYLASLVPGLPDAFKYVVMAGAV